MFVVESLLQALKQYSAFVQMHSLHSCFRSSGSGSSHPAVSTIGLGSDDTNSLIAIEDEPYRPAFARSRRKFGNLYFF